MPIQPTEPWHALFPANTPQGIVEVVSNPNHSGWDIFVDGAHAGLLGGLEVALCQSRDEIVERVAKIVRTSKMSVYEQLAEIG